MDPGDRAMKPEVREADQDARGVRDWRLRGSMHSDNESPQAEAGHTVVDTRMFSRCGQAQKVKYYTKNTPQIYIH